MITCIGSVALDTTRTPFRTVERVLGGSASFFGAAASLFHDVGVVSAVGDDFPPAYWEALERRGLDLRGVQRRTGKTFFFDSKFDLDFHHRTALRTQTGVLGDFHPVIPDAYRSAEYVFLGPIHPQREKKALKEFDGPKLAFADTIEYYVKLHRAEFVSLLGGVDGVVVNDVEARELAGTTNLVKAAYALQKMGPRLVIIKKGEHGSLGFFEDEIYPFPGFPLEDIVDPTGAGDSFAAGFVGHVARKGKLTHSIFREACVYANVMGSFCVEDFSLNRLLNLTKQQVQARYEKYKSLVSF